ncbi:MAG: hypothetical protein FD134_2734 [Gallionellaceae bacterium]|nr:MAG: hypothetical protein FD134_2734 [Gallionellaceae bacterium]
MEEMDNIIIEHLKALRNELKDFRQETREELQTIKMRLNSVERGLAGTHDDSVILQTRLDRVDGRIDRIEKRLDLTVA